MRKKVLWGGLLPGLILLLGSNLDSQENGSDIRVVVNMVQLNVAVTDNKGNYITNLRPSDFTIAEDGIMQKLATFGEGDEPTRVHRTELYLRTPKKRRQTCDSWESSVPVSGPCHRQKGEQLW